MDKAYKVLVQPVIRKVVDNNTIASGEIEIPQSAVSIGIGTLTGIILGKAAALFKVAEVAKLGIEFANGITSGFISDQLSKHIKVRLEVKLMRNNKILVTHIWCDIN